MHHGSDGAKPARRHRILLRLLAFVLMVGASAGVWVGFEGPSLGGRRLPGAVADPDIERGQDDVASRGGVRLSAACPGQRLSATRELRGMWLTSVRNLDWPSRPGLSEEQVKSEYRAWLDLAVRMNHNAVFVHVRPSGDAFWPSAYAPWSYWLTGRKDGASPGWDPMAYMVSEAHARNLEFHAWFNPYKASQFATLADMPADHILQRHHRWAVPYPKGSTRRVYFDPGVPEARAYVEDSILEAVTRYDVDGVHFDDFFYPYPENGQDFNDAYSYAKYGNGMAKADWRRQNVNLFVSEMNARIKAAKPWVKFGISPFAIWRNKKSNAAGSATNGLESYSAIFADTRRWVQAGWIDYIVPQVYWHIGNAVANYSVLVPWWANLVKGTKVQLYIGQADYRVGEAGPWKDPTQLDRQLALNEKYGVQGSVHFSARHVRDNALGAVSRYQKAHYGSPALVPTMPQLKGQPPGRPTHVTVREVADGTAVTWSPPAGPAPARYAVYRADGPDQPARLVATLSADGPGDQHWTDPVTPPAHAYCVTALDRLWNESN